MESLEREIDQLRWDRKWSKTLVAFLTMVDHKLVDHRGLAPSANFPDTWYIKKLNATFKNHNEITSYIGQLALQEVTYTRVSGAAVTTALTYEIQVSHLRDFCIMLDARHQEHAAANRAHTAMKTEIKKSLGIHTSDGEQQTARGRGGPGRGRGRGRGRGHSQGRGRGRERGRYHNFLSDDEFWSLDEDGYQRLLQARAARGELSLNTTDTQSPSTSGQSTNAHGAPTTPHTVPSTVSATTPVDAASQLSAPSRQANMLQVTPHSAAVTPSPPSPTSSHMDSGPSTLLRQMMSTASARSQPPSGDSRGTTSFAGHQSNIRRVNTTVYRYSYDLNEQRLTGSLGALMDSGANGGLVGNDTRVLSVVPNAHVDITGVTGSPITKLNLVQSASLVDTVDEGKIVLIMSQYAHQPDGKTIHSKSQLEHFGCFVHDSAKRAGGKQCVYTPEGYVIPLHVRNGLYYMDMAVPSDSDLDAFPHVFLTSDSPWNPEIVDEEFFFDPLTGPALTDDPLLSDLRRARDPRVDAYGNLQLHLTSRNDQDCDFFDCYVPSPSYTVSRLERCLDYLAIFGSFLKRRLPDLNALKPNFGWVSKQRIRDTLDKTTQHYQAEKRVPMRRHYKSRFPGANVPRLPEWYSFDTMFFPTPAFDDGVPGHGGCTMMQVFAGMDSELLHGVPMKTETEVPDTILDFIRHYGAMDGLMSDKAKSETSFAVRDILRLYTIKDHQSEPHYQHQNPVERCIQDINRTVKSIMDRVACPSGYWLLCTLYVIGLLNVLINSKGLIPLQVVTGYQVDISPYLDFHFWEEVFVEDPRGGEQLARWCGPSTKVGDFLTYNVLLNDTQQLVNRSNVRHAKDALFPNRQLRPTPSDGNTSVPVEAPVLTSIQDFYEELLNLPKFAPEELIGMTFLKDPPHSDGEPMRAKVVRQIMDRDAENHQQIKFLLAMGDGELEELIEYNRLCDLITEQMQPTSAGDGNLQTFKGVLDHQGPLKRHDPKYKGSQWNVLIDWDDGTQTWEPLNLMGKYDEITIAKYAQDNDLLNKPGWKFLRGTAKRQRLLHVALNAIKRRKDPNQVRYKFGVRLPRNYPEALQLDKENGNTLWEDAVKLELKQIQDYGTFRDMGVGVKMDPSYSKIKVRLVFDVKASGKRKGRLVA